MENGSDPLSIGCVGPLVGDHGPVRDPSIRDTLSERDCRSRRTSRSSPRSSMRVADRLECSVRKNGPLLLAGLHLHQRWLLLQHPQRTPFFHFPPSTSRELPGRQGCGWRALWRDPAPYAGAAPWTASRNGPPAPTIGSVHTRTARTRARLNGTNTTTRGQHENGCTRQHEGRQRQDHCGGPCRGPGGAAGPQRRVDRHGSPAVRGQVGRPAGRSGPGRAHGPAVAARRRATALRRCWHRPCHHRHATAGRQRQRSAGRGQGGRPCAATLPTVRAGRGSGRPDTAARVRADTAAPVVAVLNGCAPRGQDADQVTAALAGVDVQVAPVRLGQRIVLARSLLAGQVAQETEPGGRAAQEVAAVHAFIACTLERREHSNTIRGAA